jgi:hypothetical protein
MIIIIVNWIRTFISSIVKVIEWIDYWLQTKYRWLRNSIIRIDFHKQSVTVSDN